MKRITLVFAVMTLLLAAYSSIRISARTMNLTPDDNGHVLLSAWSEYEKARKADRPQKEAEILQGIRTEAMQKHLPADFYDAGRLYIETVQRRNWKDRDPARTEFERLVRQFDEPIVTYTWMGEFGGKSSDERWEFVRNAADAFGKASHPEFHRGLGSYLGGAIKEFIASDREYVLWDLLRHRELSSWAEPGKDEVYAALKAEIGERYPAWPALRYYTASRLPEKERKAAFEQLSADPSMGAVGLWPKGDLLEMRFSELFRNDGKSDDYQKLFSDCEAWLKEKGRLSGADARLLEPDKDVQNLVDRLKDQSLSVSVSKDSVMVMFRNLTQAEVTLDGKRYPVRNDRGSFYAWDHVSLPLPALDDGSYTIEAKSGKLSSRTSYRKHTVSLAHRAEADGFAVYAADYLTGKPLDEYRLILRKGDRIVASETVRQNGFTRLPASMAQILRSNRNTYYALQAEVRGEQGLTRRSEQVSVGGFRYDPGRTTEGKYCNVYLDRGAFNPGDTLQFKAILFKGDLTKSAAVVPGASLEVQLRNAQDDELERKVLKTNEFGSIAGSFVLPVGQRGGYFSLHIYQGKDLVGSSSFRVDEFILPTFTLQFEPVEKLFLPGDEAQVRGRIQSYSGHSLSGATVTAQVLRYGELIAELPVEPAADGTFSLHFQAAHEGWHEVTVKVVDATGETLDFHTGVNVADAVTVEMDLENEAEGEFVAVDASRTVYRPHYRPGRRFIEREDWLVDQAVARVRMTARNAQGDKVPGTVSYVLKNQAGTVVDSASVASGTVVELALPASGLYDLAASTEVEGRDIKDEAQARILKVASDDIILDAPVRRFFRPGESTVRQGGKIRLQMGTADGNQWAVVTVFGRDREILDNRLVFLEGALGKEGSATTLEWDYPSSWPEAVRVHVFYFKYGETIEYDHEFFRVRTTLDLPLAFSSFTDKTQPGTEYTFTLQTLPGVEALAAVWDKSIDAIADNHWPMVYLHHFSPAWVPYNSVNGSVTGVNPFFYGPKFPGMEDVEEFLEEEEAIPFQLNRAGLGAVRMSAKNAATMVYAEEAVEDAPMAASHVMLDDVDAEMTDDAGASGPDVPIREKFENALTFQPFLRSDADGKVSFSFRTSDKLSTYYVSVFAHDPAMRNALVRQEMVVTTPVKVSVVEPSYLYAGDRYRMDVSVANNAGRDLADGQVVLRLFRSADRNTTPYKTLTAPLPLLRDGGTETVHCTIEVDPDLVAGGVLGIQASYVAGSVSDGLFVTVPVRPAVQTLTEAHSAVLLAGMDKEALVARLHEAFVNTSGYGAAYDEISIIDMVRDALPSKAEPSGRDVLSLSEAWYVRQVAGSLGVVFDPETPTEKLLEQIRACQNADGGFGWFEGMKSSPVITAVLLERFAKVAALGLARVDGLEKAVRFLDRNQFDHAWPLWCGGLSADQYLFVRSYYPSVPFEVKASGNDTAFSKRMKEFRKYATDYLVPKKERGLSGAILAKARRLRTLQNLLEREGGVALAKAWGLSSAAAGRMRRSLNADAVSLLEYAVDHRDGGMYYPNAVMPWRGLLESEAYAHALLCDLLAGLPDAAAVPAGEKVAPAAVADGIRLWLMLQKETQQWDTDPAFVDAIYSVLQGSEAVKQTRVILMKQSFEKPFPQIAAAGNGFTVTRKFFRSSGVEEVYNDRTEDRNRTMLQWQEIQPGTMLQVGDRIRVEYRIWNAENRSFVKLSAPREAALRPVDQLSGHYGWGIAAYRMVGGWSFQPQGYRDVRADHTDFYFDSYPEENTKIVEEFFVSRAGEFTAPVVSIESLYAPHYRANDGYAAPLRAE